MKNFISFLIIAVGLLTAAINTSKGQNRPKITVRDEGRDYPLKLSKLNIKVQVTGNIAVTCYYMTFSNAENRVLEGEFEFPLVEGQTVSGFSLEINGSMREGVVVEKAKGRETFEKIVRRRVDPGLLEQTKGNIFRSRIYPIPAMNTKSLVLSYEQELPYVNNELVYMLPLQFEDKINNFSIDIEVVKQPFKLNSVKNGLDNFQFSQWEDIYKAHAEYSNYCPNKQLAFVIPHTSDGQDIYTELVPGNNDQNYFYIHTIPQLITRDKKLPGSVCLLWDASNSASKKDINQELKVLEGYFKKIGDLTVRLVIFRNEADDPVDFTIKDGNCAKLIKYINDIPYDGGTQLGSLNLQNYPCDEFILSSDGMSNFGESEIRLSKIPVMVINSCAIADFSTLKYISATTGGRFINLPACTTQEAVDNLLKQEYRFISADYNQNIVSETYPSIPTAFNRSFTLSGKLKGKWSKIILNFGIGKETLHSDTIIIRKDNKISSTGILGRLWAEKKLAELDMGYEKNKEQITELGKEFSIVTRNTSLIVLDQLEDYVQNKIVPPKDMQDDYFAMIKARESSRQQEIENHIEEVVREFEQRKLWWNKDFDKVEKVRPEQRHDTNSNHTQTNTREYDHGQITMSQSSGGRTTGMVTDISTGEAIPGVNIVVKGTQSGTISDLDGRYTIDLPAGGTLVFSFIGYVAEEVTLGVNQIVDVALAPEIHRLDEVVVVGYGVQRREDVTASVSQVSGRLAGVSVDQKEDDKEQDMTDSQEENRKVSIVLSGWDPEMPYLNRLKEVSKKELYSTYLELRKEYESAPSFFLDVADFFNKDGESKIALRILSNIAELKTEDHQLLRVLGHRLQQLGYYKLAVKTFREVLKIRNEEPQSYRDLSLALAADNCYQESVDILYSLVQKKWDNRFPGIELIAVGEMNSIIARAKDVDISRIDKRLLENLPVDVRIVLNWDADNCDMDLWVTCPDGEKCMYSNRFTKTGGMISNDFTGGYGPEEFIIKKGLTGTYKIEVNYYGSTQQKVTGPTTIQVELYTNYGKKSEKQEAITMQLSEKLEVITAGELVFDK
jgi:hypothetical protein